MGHIERNLMAGEQIVLQVRLHSIIFARAVFILILGIAFFIIVGGEAARAFAAVVIFAGLVDATSAWVTRITSEFAVTNKRVMIKTGLIRRRTVEMNLQKVESITVDQGLLGRMLNYGDISVTGSGGSRDPFRKIEKPMAFRDAVYKGTELASEQANTKKI